MRNIGIIVLCVISTIIGFFIGRSNGYEEAEKYRGYRGIESVKLELKQKEIKEILVLLDGKAKIETRKIGGVFSSKKEKYFTGNIQNNSLMARAKDVEVRVTFLSKTKSELGSTEFKIYEYIEPNESQSFERKIETFKDVEGFKWNIVSALGE
nr:hypothetical protein [uncultured Allomuricauda sp.]